jgi:FkbM family methyltransferase
MNIRKFLSDPLSYIPYTKYLLAGYYFDYVLKYYRVGNCKFLIPKELTTRNGRGYFALNNYEKSEQLIIKSFDFQPYTILEMGGCLGVISCLLNKTLASPENHVVLEANPKIIPYLQQNKTINNCHFTIENKVISDNGVEIFYFGDSIVSGSIDTNKNSHEKVEIQTTTVQKLQNQYSVHFNAIVMDIEGGEYSFIKNNQEFLNQIAVVMMENHPSILQHDRIEEYENILRSKGFEIKIQEGTSQLWVKPTNMNNS